jgi:hypothetical protein
LFREEQMGVRMSLVDIAELCWHIADTWDARRAKDRVEAIERLEVRDRESAA